jgi:multidrug efflux system membrane fusion protein
MDEVRTRDTDVVTPTRRRISGRGRLLGALVAFAVLAGLAWLAWDLTHPAATPGPNATATKSGARPASAARGGPPATTVGVATAELASIPVVLEALGTVTPAATVTVRPQVSGVLQAVHFREGQTVKQGQLLATIDPRQFEMAVMQATGQRMRDEAQLENARLTLQRFQTLLQQDSIARQEVDTQAALVKQLEAAVMTDRANEGTARLNLGYTRITTPINGRVGLRVVDIGNLVSSNDANGIAVITQLDPIDVEFAVPQDMVPEVQTQANRSGAKLPVVALDRTRTTELATGIFSTLDNQVDTQTGTVRAKARFSNVKESLFPSQFVNVRLLLRTIENAVVVPVTALRHGSQGDFVYVLNAADSTVSQRAVTRGQATVDKVAITSGLKAGEQVITEGADRLKDGSRVTLPGSPAQAPAGGPDGTQRERGARGKAAATP